MYIIVGRGGILNVFLALFIFLGFLVWKLLFYMLVGIAMIVIVLVATVQVLWDHHKAKKLRDNPPRPQMSPVSGPRDWTPP